MTLTIYHAPVGNQVRKSFCAPPFRGVVFTKGVHKAQDVAGVSVKPQILRLAVCDGSGQDGEAIARAALEASNRKPLNVGRNDRLLDQIKQRLPPNVQGRSTITELIFTLDLSDVYLGTGTIAGDSPLFSRRSGVWISHSPDIVYDPASKSHVSASTMRLAKYRHDRNYCIGGVLFKPNRAYFERMVEDNQAHSSSVYLTPGDLVVLGSDMLSKMLGVKTDRHGNITDASGVRDLSRVIGTTTDPEHAATLLIEAYEERSLFAKTRKIIGVGDAGRVLFADDDFTFIIATRDS